MTQAKFVHDGDTLKHTPGSAITGGDVVVVGNRALVSKLDIEAGRVGALAKEDVFDVVKKTGAFSDGDRVYWDPTGDPVGGTAGSGAATSVVTKYFMGFANGDAASGDARVRVDVCDCPGAEVVSEITDPGASGAIPVTKSGHVLIVTAGAETRTLARPTFVGQRLQLIMKTDGGDCVITVTGNVNQTGNTTITLNDAGDCVTLIGSQSGSTKKWSVLANDGATLSTP